MAKGPAAERDQETQKLAVLARNSSTRLRGESTKWAVDQRTLTRVPILR